MQPPGASWSISGTCAGAAMPERHHFHLDGWPISASGPYPEALAIAERFFLIKFGRLPRVVAPA